MCTVSYVFENGKAILTSNRDEKILRPKAIVPKTYYINSKKLFFPKDPKAGGTWFAVSENGTVVVLLNGADKKHEPKSTYRVSRGLIVLEIISNTQPLFFWNQIDLQEVEPFTLILYCDAKLYQLRWDGSQKSETTLDETQHYIWSSATLYPKEVRVAREKWFTDFMKSKTNIQEQDILFFHENAQSNDTTNGLVVNRNNVLRTQSITQTVIEQNKISFVYKDLLEATEYHNNFLLV